MEVQEPLMLIALIRAITFTISIKLTRVVERKFPWGIILLMGGGFALAEGASKSCLTHLVSIVPFEIFNQSGEET